MGDCMLYEFKTCPSRIISAREKTGKIYKMFFWVHLRPVNAGAGRPYMTKLKFHSWLKTGASRGLRGFQRALYFEISII